MPMAASAPLAAPSPPLPRPAVAAISGILLASGLAVALLWPDQAGLALAAVFGVIVLLLAFAFPTLACMGWLVAVGLTPDMWFGEFFGDGVAVSVVAALKFAGLLLVVLSLLRYGPAWDGFNPGFAFAAMFAVGIVHGLHPNLDAGESFRSFLGSAAPFAFCFVRLPREWSRGVILAVLGLPLASILLGAVLTVAGLHPLLVEGAGLRLQGAGHPAFLAGFALTAMYAALTELLRTGKWRFVFALALNLAILVLTGARAPLAIGMAVTFLALIAAPSARFSWPARCALLLGFGVIGAILFAAGSALNTMRIFNLLATDADNLSGRDEIWPMFQAAWDASPWWGWGVGAGKVLVDVDSPLARLLGTTAAHNEYLRIGVEGGYVGLALLVMFFVLWAWTHLRVLRGSDRAIMALVLIGFAVHSATDNTLIATTSSVLFTWVTAVFARGARQAEIGNLPEEVA